MGHGSTFLANLNAGDDTPGDVGYCRIYSNLGRESMATGPVSVGPLGRVSRTGRPTS
jgi:hypothetical protein